MNPEPYTLFFSILGLGAIGLILLDAVSRITDNESLSKFTTPISLELATAVALTSMGGSLFFSEALGFEPCFLCWVQRGLMYPAALLLLMDSVAVNFVNKTTGTLTRIKRLAGIHLGVWLAVILAIPGFAIALFHRYDQSVESELSFCDAAVPCSARYFNTFGFITIPTLAAIGFAAISYFGIQVIRAERKQRKEALLISSKE